MASKNDARWLEQFDAFKDYVSQNAKFPPLKNFVHKGINIGSWYANQLTAYRDNFLPPERRAMLDEFNPVWRGTYEERLDESKRMLLASSAWKTNLPENEVPIDKVFSGEDLYACLSRGIYTCMDFLKKCESHLTAKGFPFYRENVSASFESNLFRLENREAAFEAQFTNLSFGYFNVFLAVYGSDSDDLFKPEEIDVLGRTPNYFEAAAALSAYSKFDTREGMVKAFENLFGTLVSREADVLTKKYIHGMTIKAISDELGFSYARVKSLEYKGLRKLKHPSRAKYVRPEHPQDKAIREEKEALELKRQAEEEAYAAAQLKAKRDENISVDPSVIANKRIEDLDLSVRSLTCLRRHNYTTLGKIASLSMRELLQIRNLGRKSAEEILGKLDEHGLFVVPDYDPEYEKELKAKYPSLYRFESYTSRETSIPQKQLVESSPQKERKLSLEEQIAAANSKRNPPGGGGPGGIDGPGGGTPGGAGSTAKEPPKDKTFTKVHAPIEVER